MIIGVLDDTKDNLLIPRFIVQYNKKYEMSQDLLLISTNGYQIFEKNLNLGGEKIKKMDKKIVYEIDKFKYIKNNNIDNNNNDLNYFHENIKLLFYLYGNYEELNYIIQLSNEQKEKKYYMNKIKEIFCYNKFCEEIKEKNISNIISNIKKKNFISEMNFNELFNNIKDKFSKDFIGLLSINIKEKHQNEIKDEKLMCVSKQNMSKHEKDNNESLCYYYTYFEIISEQVKQYLLDNNYLSNQNEIIKIECIIIDNKLILYPNPRISNIKDGKNILISGYINKTNEFISEYLFNFKETNQLKNYLKHFEQKWIQ